MISQKQQSIQKFQKKTCKAGSNPFQGVEALWIYSQLHEGLDTFLTADQKRVPFEIKFPATEIKNSVTFTVEAAESEKNGSGIMSDHDLQFMCDKDRRASPISMEDIKRALGDIVTFSK